MSSFIERHKKGVIGTIVFHTLLLLVMVFTTLTTTPPTFPQPEGLVVNFGMDETGLGAEEPTKSDNSASVQAEDQAQETPSEQSSSSSQTEEAIADNTPNPVITQEVEDAPAIAAKEKKRKEEEQKRLIELEQKRVEAEKKHIADEEQKQRDEEQRKIAEAKQKQDAAAQKIRDKAKSAFGQSSGNSSSQGVAGGEGNQGKPDGQVGVNNYKGGGQGNGIDWSLNGREVVDLPRPSRGIQASGKVIVEIIVDNNGQVIEATPGKKGSTTTDGRLYEAAQRAAMKAKFNVSASAPPHQKGTITYIFELQ